jgi:hypothetical protein
MIESEHAAFDLPELDRTNDPQGGAVAWALLALNAALILGPIIAVILVR